MISAIVLANSKTPVEHQMTTDCLRTLTDAGQFDVTVVEQTDRAHPLANQIVRPQQPFNFNEFVQLGWQASKRHDVIAVLNNDLVFQPGFLPPLLAALETYDSVSPWAPGVHDGHLPPGFRYHEGYRTWYEVAGWALFFRRSILDKVSFAELFPADFAGWYSDNWYAFQLQRHGFRHALVTDSKVVHLVSRSQHLLPPNRLWTVSDQAKEIFDAKVAEVIRTDGRVVLTVALLSVPERLQEFSRIYRKLTEQAKGLPCEVVALTDNKKSTCGRKRDFLVQMARGSFVSFVDDDDDVADDYVTTLLGLIETNPGADVITFEVIATDNFGRRIVTTYGDRDNNDNPGHYIRRPGHLCCWRTDLAKQTRYSDVTFGEDSDWSARAAARNIVNINRPLYFYRIGSTEAQSPRAKFERQYRAQEPIPTLTALKPGLRIAVYTIAKNEAKHVQRWAESAKDADVLLVADTGSTDSTVALLYASGVRVHSISIDPWRFDAARNAALALVPADIDMCVSLDLDEVLEPGWRAGLESAWKPGATRCWHWFKFTETCESREHRIHARHGCLWKWPVHELAMRAYGLPEIEADAGKSIVIRHLPDPSKSRAQYLPLLEAATNEDRCSRLLFYLGREYYYAGMKEKTIETLREYLAHQEADWHAERCTAMRMIAKSVPDRAAAIRWLKRASLEDPTMREPLLDLAELHAQAEEWPQALGVVEEARKLIERPNHFLVEARCWEDLGALAERFRRSIR